MASWGAPDERAEPGVCGPADRTGLRSPPLSPDPAGPVEAPLSGRRPVGLYVSGVLLVLSPVIFVAGVVGMALDLWVSYSLLPPGAGKPIASDDVTWLLAGWVATIGLVAVLYSVFSVAAVAGSGLARLVVMAMTALFTLLDVFAYGLFVLESTYSYSWATADVSEVVRMLLVPMVLALIGTILLFTPAANRFFAGSGSGDAAGGRRL
jgi:hypothetical protein